MVISFISVKVVFDVIRGHQTPNLGDPGSLLVKIKKNGVVRKLPRAKREALKRRPVHKLPRAKRGAKK